MNGYGYSDSEEEMRYNVRKQRDKAMYSHPRVPVSSLPSMKRNRELSADSYIGPYDDSETMDDHSSSRQSLMKHARKKTREGSNPSQDEKLDKILAAVSSISDRVSVLERGVVFKDDRSRVKNDGASVVKAHNQIEPSSSMDEYGEASTSNNTMTPDEKKLNAKFSADARKRFMLTDMFAEAPVRDAICSKASLAVYKNPTHWMRNRIAERSAKNLHVNLRASLKTKILRMLTPLINLGKKVGYQDEEDIIRHKYHIHLSFDPEYDETPIYDKYRSPVLIGALKILYRTQTEGARQAVASREQWDSFPLPIIGFTVALLENVLVNGGELASQKYAPISQEHIDALMEMKTQYMEVFEDLMLFLWTQSDPKPKEVTDPQHLSPVSNLLSDHEEDDKVLFDDDAHVDDGLVSDGSSDLHGGNGERDDDHRNGSDSIYITVPSVTQPRQPLRTTTRGVVLPDKEVSTAKPNQTKKSTSFNEVNTVKVKSVMAPDTQLGSSKRDGGEKVRVVDTGKTNKNLPLSKAGTTLEDTTVHSSAAATESITKKPVSRSYLMPPPAYPPSKPSSGITKTSIAPSSEVPVLYRLSPSPMKGSSGDLKGGESIKASTASKAQLSASNKVPIKASSAISKGSGSIATKSSQKKQIDQEDEDDDSSTIVVGVQQGVNLDHAEDSAAAAALMKLGGRGTTSGTPTSTTRMKMLEERNSRRGVARKNYRE